jgi:chromosome segregation protein
MDIGVRIILENKRALSGVHGIVKDLLNVEAQYEKSILTALGRSMQDVVVETSADAQDAVAFLKSNRAGKATFLPLNTIKSRNVKPEIAEALKTRPGFINIASNLITFDPKYENIFTFLLGNVIIAEDLNSAITLSKYAYQLYRVISLDGDIVGAGGAITGGFNKVNPAMSINLDIKLKELTEQFQTLDSSLTECRIELDKVTAEFNEINAKQYEKKLTLSKYEESIKLNEGHYFEYEMRYDQLVKSHNLADKREQWNENSLNESIAKLNSRKDKLNEELSVARQTKTIHKAKVEDQEAKLTELRFQIDRHRDIISKHETDKVKCESILQNARERINKDYRMTIEYVIENYQNELPMSDNQARDIIDRLRGEIDRIGAINMEAMNELEDKQKRCDDLTTQQQQLEQAKTDMLKIISELDNKAREDFAKTIDSVNETLPSVFKYLFGGGSCRLEYVNPEDILTSGIDVSANPPGKNIVHLNLLSGGEKTLVALSILFSILKNKSFPLVILDEAESALDPANVERFGNIIKQNSDKTQFIVITHRPGTMERCDTLFGATMQVKGITSIYKVTLSQAKNEFASDDDKE